LPTVRDAHEVVDAPVLLLKKLFPELRIIYLADEFQLHDLVSGNTTQIAVPGPALFPGPPGLE
jgi:hypothetical protein